MTTNGHLLAELAGPLAAAGLVGGQRLARHARRRRGSRELTGRGDLRAGARRHRRRRRRRARGQDSTRSRSRGVNDDELAALCSYAWERGATPRFIEHMPMSAGELYAADAELTAAAIRAAVEAALGPLSAGERRGGDRRPGPLLAPRREPAARSASSRR